MNFFTLFDLPEQFAIDLPLLSERFQTLQRRYHPDTVATQSQAERLQAMQQAANINQGYQALRKPLPRAEHLLCLQGIDINNEQHTLRDTDFLMAQLTLREELDDIEQQQDDQRLSAWLAGVSQQQTTLMTQLSEQLDQQQWLVAANQVRKLRFFSKLVEQSEVLEEKWLDF